jgi:flagellar biosynthesis/type III secretory pathway protein FliH
MTGFCVDSITPAPDLRAVHGILRAAAFSVTTDARLVAQRIEREAQEQADQLLDAARAEAAQIAGEAERQVFERAGVLLEALEAMQATLIERSQEVVIDLTRNLFDRLVMQTTPREQIEAMLQRVLQEAPPKLVEPVLRVHPDDVELLPTVNWDIKPDPQLSRGACRLEASYGQWCADFGGAVEALRSAFVDAVNTPIAVAEEETSDGEPDSGEDDGQDIHPAAH